MPAAPEPLLRLNFEADIIHWRGPSPFFFVAVPAELAGEISRVAKAVSYGWGMIPVQASIDEVGFTTSLFPKDATYMLPLKLVVRRQADITAGDRIGVDIVIRPAK